MADSNKDIITITKVENLKDNNRLDKNEELDLFIDLANLPGFKNDDEIINKNIHFLLPLISELEKL